MKHSVYTIKVHYPNEPSADFQETDRASEIAYRWPIVKPFIRQAGQEDGPAYLLADVGEMRLVPMRVSPETAEEVLE